MALNCSGGATLHCCRFLTWHKFCTHMCVSALPFFCAGMSLLLPSLEKAEGYRAMSNTCCLGYMEDAVTRYEHLNVRSCK